MAGERTIGKGLCAIDECMPHWQEAVDKGLNLKLAAGNLNRLAREKEGLEEELALARERESMSLDLEEAAREAMAGDRIPRACREVPAQARRAVDRRLVAHARKR